MLLGFRFVIGQVSKNILVFKLGILLKLLSLKAKKLALTLAVFYVEQQVVLISLQQQVEWQGLATNTVHLFIGVMGMDTTRRRLKSAATSSPMHGSAGASVAGKFGESIQKNTSVILIESLYYVKQ